MIDVATISLAEIIIGITSIAAVVGGGAIMKYRQDRSDTQRIEDKAQFAKDKKENREYFERELKRIETDSRERSKTLREELRVDREAFMNHNDANQAIRDTLTSLTAHFEHFVEDLKEIKDDLKEVKKNGNGYKQNS